MEKTEDWITEKVSEYKQNPKETLKNMLVATNDVMLQYKNDPTNKANKGLFDSCIEHNSLFFIKIAECN